MRQLNFFLLGGFCISLQSKAIAQPQFQAKMAYLNFSLGYSGQALKELNAEIEEGSWKGSNLITEAFVGYRLHLVAPLGLLFRGGYRFRNLGPFDGSVRSPQFGSAEGPYVNNEGDSVEFDFSGVYLTAGLSVVLGPPRDKGK